MFFFVNNKCLWFSWRTFSCHVLEQLVGQFLREHWSPDETHGAVASFAAQSF